MARRGRAREVALQILYQFELNSDWSDEQAREFLQGRIREPELRELCWEFASGVRQHRERIDERLGLIAENWKISRMPVIDRNILRLGVYELVENPQLPPLVALNEALLLAKRYSTAKSSQFVNGVLDQIRSRSQTTQSESSSPGESPEKPPQAPSTASA